MAKFIFLFLFAMALFIAASIRIEERLSCNVTRSLAGQSTVQLDCTRVQKYLFYERTMQASIRDLSSIKVNNQMAASASRKSDWFIEAKSVQGEGVHLLSIPEDVISYATDLEKRMQSVATSGESEIYYERNERKTATALFGALGVYLIALIYGMKRYLKGRVY